MNKEALIKYFDEISSSRGYWERKNRYYYRYLDGFVNFLVPKGKKSFRIKVGQSDFWKNYSEIKEKSLDYLIANDVLGYVSDVENFMRDASKVLKDDGRLVITQYSALWEGILRIASKLKLRMSMPVEQNWLSTLDLHNFSRLADFEIVKSGSKMLCPKYIPLLSGFLNRFVANIFPFSRLGVFHYLVARKRVRLADRANPSLSIIVPARNEAGTIEEIARELPSLGSFTELIFIEGNSTDNTFAEIEKVAQKYKNTKRIKYAKQDGRGKGDAVRKGFEMAEGDILAIYDADMTVPAGEVAKFYRAMVENKGDFINGSRLVYPLEKESMRVLNFFGNKFFSFAFSAILGQPLKDTLCGTKVLWKKDYEDIKKNRAFFGDFDPFGDFDLLFGAAKLNLKIIDMPIHYKERVYGSTNISRWKHGWLLLKMTVFAARKIKFI